MLDREGCCRCQLESVREGNVIKGKVVAAWLLLSLTSNYQVDASKNDCKRIFFACLIIFQAFEA